ncbi:hypothetical protein GCM10023339_22920 [Alloalcanivorax gelatiniphagus]
MRHPARLRTAALACLLAGTTALAGCGDQPADDAGASGGSAARDRTATDATAAEPGTAIPDDFPLSAGMGGPQDRIPTSRTGTGLRDLELCGASPLRGLGSRDRLVADNSGGESVNTRELLLLGSPETAADVARSLSGTPSDCDVRLESSGWETSTEVRESPFGPSPSAVLVQTYTLDGKPTPGAMVVHVVPVGAALLVAQVYGEWEDLGQGIASTVPDLRDAVSAMAMFDDAATPTPTPTQEPTTTTTGTPSQAPTQEPSEDPTEEPSEVPTEEPTAGPGETADVPSVVEIPADFPLAAGLPEDDGETTVSEPSADGDGMGEVEVCGRIVWPHSRTTDVGETRRLVTGAQGPEYFDGRELIVHADADAAVEAVATVREAADECRTFDDQVWTVLERDTGYDTVTVGLTYAQGLGSSVFQVTRVGSAVLMVQTYGEGSLASLDGQADEVTGTTGTIVPAMCVFTKTGC